MPVLFNCCNQPAAVGFARPQISKVGADKDFVLIYTRQVCKMKGGGSTVSKQRINVILPDETVNRLNKVVKKGDRSNLLDFAVNHYGTCQ